MANETLTQANSPLRLTTPLGTDALLLTGFTIREGISQLFNMQLDAIAKNSQNVAFDKLLGQKVAIEVVLKDKSRFWNGIVCRVEQWGRDREFTAYRLEVVPQFWLLKRNGQSRIFQHVSVVDILKTVLKGVDTAFEIQGTFLPRDFCVQYRETDFNFASRLMEEEGIYYFFKHTAAGHTMVLANTPQSHPAMPQQSDFIYEEVLGGTRDDHRVTAWGKVQELRSGKSTLFDHCFQLPHQHLDASKTIVDSVKVGTVDHKLKVGGNASMELYDYPGEYAQRFDDIDASGGEKPADIQNIFKDNARTVGIRMEQETVPGLVIQGSSDCRQFVTGHKFNLTRHFNADGAYLLTAATHVARQGSFQATGGGSFQYSNNFICIPLAQPYRPQRVALKPIIQGTQTAVVVGPAGEEIFTDKYGRIKVQFHWDRQGKNDANSSCWCRVAQIFAGKRWGASFWPRIGQEVVVDFLEGDPDQPIVVGSVYNADQMPPYQGNGLDSKHTHDNKVSGVKTNSTPGGVGFNEWRFDDTKGKEEIFIHAEKNIDTRVKNDCMELILHDRHLIVGTEKDGKKVGDQREQVFQDKHLNVKRNHVEHIEGNMELMVGHGKAEAGGDQDIVIEKNKTELIEKNTQLHVKENRLEKIDKDQSLTVVGSRFEAIKKDHHQTVTGSCVEHYGAQALSVGGDKMEAIGGVHHHNVKGDRNEKVGGVQSLTVTGDQQEKVGGNHGLEAQEIHLKAGMKVIIEAGVQLSLKGPGGFVDIGPSGVTIQGTMVLINSGGSAGSGSGSSPTAPKDPAAPKKPVEPPDAKQAKPIVPTLADDSKSGSKSAPEQ